MRYSKKYIIMTLILGILAVAEFRNYARDFEEVEKFRGALLEESVWNPLIADSVNQKQICVMIDNKVYTSRNSPIYMDQNLNLMLPISMLTESFQCSSHLYDQQDLLLEKYSDEIHIKLDNYVMDVNGKKVETRSTLTKKGEEYFVPMQAVAKNLGFSYKWDPNENTGTAVNEKESATNLPYKYDLREKRRVTQVKDQGKFGTCWAFAALTALESSILPEEVVTYSPDHMSMKNSFQSGQNAGGEYTMGMAYLMAWQGPVLEQDDPYGDGISVDGLSAIKHVQEAQILAEKDYTAIKEAIFKYGGVQSSIYSSLMNSSSESEYFNKATNAYCYMGAEKPNHDIVIVGWDDQYPKENFSMELEGDGAFICQNSWGEAFGENGYFYVSYYDTNIGIHNLVYSKVENTSNYDHNYQSDLCGWIGQIGYNNESIYGANVFTADSAQSVEAAGFYATAVDTSYEIFVVRDFKNEKSLRERVKVAEGTLSNAGYYTIPFENAVHVEQGERFAVVLKIKTPGAVHPLAIEYPADEETANVDLSDGEGYISQTGGNTWEHVEETQQCNLCIKAYTRNR
ncbi:MAG: lectin like domain-containing protein [Lachnospiraceae bacterium]